MENNQRNNDQVISINMNQSFNSLDAIDLFNQQSQEEQHRIRENLDQIQEQENFYQQEQNHEIAQHLAQIQQNHHFFVLDFSTAQAKYELVYFIVLIIELLSGVKIPIVCFSWIGWYIVFGTCWSRNNSNNCIMIISEIVKLVIVGWGLCSWVFQPLSMLVYLFLLLNVDSIVKIPVMLCTSCIVCLCASSICCLCIKIKFEMKSKNQKKAKFLQQLKKKQKTIVKKSSITTNFSKSLQQMSDELPMPKQQNEPQKLNTNAKKQTMIQQFQKMQESQCPICLQIFQTTYVQVQCSHKFHYDCIKTWLQTTSTCPICRKQLY